MWGARLFFNIAIGLLTLTYPFAVYFGIHYVEPWQMAIVLMSLLALRQALSGAKLGGWLLLPAGIGFCAIAILRNDLATLRLYPVVVNAVLLSVFAWSLLNPPTVIERLARLRRPALPQSGVVYTRRVTQVWCAFFMLNGTLALVTALWGSFALWSLYNGFIAYLLMGVLFGVEYLVRIKTQKQAG